MPDSTGSIGIGIPISPVEQTSTSRGAQPSDLGGELGHAQRVARPASPVAALALPELSTTAAARPSCEVDAADLHRRRRDQVGREHTGGGDRRVVGGGDHRQVGRARRLDAARQTRPASKPARR